MHAPSIPRKKDFSPFFLLSVTVTPPRRCMSHVLIFFFIVLFLGLMFKFFMYFCFTMACYRCIYSNPFNRFAGSINLYQKRQHPFLIQKGVIQLDRKLFMCTCYHLLSYSLFHLALLSASTAHESCSTFCCSSICALFALSRSALASAMQT